MRLGEVLIFEDLLISPFEYVSQDRGRQNGGFLLVALRMKRVPSKSTPNCPAKAIARRQLLSDVRAGLGERHWAKAGRPICMIYIYIYVYVYIDSFRRSFPGCCVCMFGHLVSFEVSKQAVFGCL